MTSAPLGSPARVWAAYASLGAGLVHAAVVGEHLAEWWAAGVFFALLAAYQLGWAVACLAWERVPLLVPTVLLTAATLALWLVSRSTGLPVGPDAWSPEAVGVPDVASGVLELVLLGSIAVAARGARSPVRPSGAGRRLVVLGLGALLVSGVTTPALAATPAGGAAHPHGSHDAPGEPAGP